MKKTFDYLWKTREGNILFMPQMDEVRLQTALKSCQERYVKYGYESSLLAQRMMEKCPELMRDDVSEEEIRICEIRCSDIVRRMQKLRGSSALLLQKIAELTIVMVSQNIQIPEYSKEMQRPEFRTYVLNMEKAVLRHIDPKSKSPFSHDISN